MSDDLKILYPKTAARLARIMFEEGHYYDAQREAAALGTEISGVSGYMRYAWHERPLEIKSRYTLKARMGRLKLCLLFLVLVLALAVLAMAVADSALTPYSIPKLPTPSVPRPTPSTLQ